MSRALPDRADEGVCLYVFLADSKTGYGVQWDAQGRGRPRPHIYIAMSVISCASASRTFCTRESAEKGLGK